MKEEKTRVNIYIDTDLKKLAELQTDNFSGLVNRLLKNYLNVKSEEQINIKIDEHMDAIKILNVKLETLRSQGIKKTNEEAIAANCLDELRKSYVSRRRFMDDSFDNIWITSPANIDRCRLMGKSPDDVLFDLRSWYNDGGKVK